MVDKKTQFTASVQIPTKKTLDDYADEHNLNRSQALTEIVDQWSELTDDGEHRPMQLEVSTPGEEPEGGDGPAKGVSVAEEDTLTLLSEGGKTTAIGGALMLTWWVFTLPAAPAAVVAALGVPIAALGVWFTWLAGKRLTGDDDSGTPADTGAEA